MDIFESQKYIVRLDELRTKYEASFQKEKMRTHKRRWRLIRTIIFLSLSAMLLLSLHSSFGPDGDITGVIFITVYGFLPAIIVTSIVSSKTRRSTITRAPSAQEIAATRKKKPQETTAMENEMQQITEILQSSELPPRYHYTYAVNWMIDAFQCKRADSIKEAINLYEDFLQKERHNEEVVDAIKRIKINNNYYYV